MSDASPKRVEFAARMDWRAYVPQLGWAWWDGDEGCLWLHVGNRHCDPLLLLELTFRRIPRCLGGRPAFQRDDYLWNGQPMRGLCGHCQVHVDSTDPNHRVTSIMRGGRGVECVLRGDIEPSEGGPLAKSGTERGA